MKVQTGQVWRDKDHREDRTVRVESFDDNFVYCKVLTNTNGAKTGHTTRIRINQFIRRYKLAAE